MAELYRLHECTVTAEEAPLYAVAADAVGDLTRRKARMAITAGLVAVGGTVVTDPQAVQNGQLALRIDLRQGIPAAGAQRARGGLKASKGAGTATDRPFAILHRDNDVLVVDKAAGLLAAPTEKGEKGHVLELIRNWAKGRGEDLGYLGQIHRIDMPTSGCLVIALTREAQSLLGTQFATHCAERRYRCLVYGGPKQESDRLDGKMGRGPDGRRAVVTGGRPGKEAVTHFTVVKRYADYTDLQCRLETGRTHQIRVHLASIGCPILGDDLYSRRGAHRPTGPKVPRLMLHAHQVSFDHPRTGERMTIEAELPAVYQAMLG